jgi:uncharacterized protein with ParB-like and HNH nuclease domain
VVRSFFQRSSESYVWKSGQIAYLLDSLYRGYPSGSMLLWKPSAEVQVRGLAIEASGKAPAHSPLYLLDGQQRLTSLHRVIHGHAEAEVVFFAARLSDSRFRAGDQRIHDGFASPTPSETRR